MLTDSLDGHVGTVSIRGIQLTTLRIADGVDGLSGSKTELRQLMSSIERASKDYGIDISGVKKTVMTNNNRGMTTDL